MSALARLGSLFSRSKPVTDSKSCPPDSGGRSGWDMFGIPQDSGNGFDYNLDHALWFQDGRIVSERAILQLSTAWACVRLLSQTIATMPLNFFKREPDGDRDLAPAHPLYSILHNQPNADMTATDYWQVILALMLLRGNAVSEKDMIGDTLVGLTPLPCVSWMRQPDGRYLYTATENGRMRILDESQVWHIPAFTINGRQGLSPICYGGNVFGSARAADIASHSLFDNGMKASGFVTFPPNSPFLTKDQRAQFEGSLSRFSNSRTAGKSFVLEGGADYRQLTMNADDAQMLETRSFSVEEICRWFGVPPTLIGHGDKTSNWGTGLEQQNQSFLTYSLSPWLKKIESSIWSNLISQADKAAYFAEFSVEGLLRADTAGRASFYSSLSQNGIMTRDEIRKKENLPAMGGGAETLTVQAALVPLDQLGARFDAATGQTDPTATGLPTDGAPTDANSVQATALNGAQVTALQELLAGAATGTLPIETVRAAIRAAFPLLTEAEISDMIAPLATFTPKPDPKPTEPVIVP